VRRCDERVVIWSTSGDAPLDTSERCDAPSPSSALLSNTHCIARPGNPRNGTSRTGRSNHKFTVMIDDDAIALARDRIFESSGG
jgi:hypothetical protein